MKIKAVDKSWARTVMDTCKFGLNSNDWVKAPVKSVAFSAAEVVGRVAEDVFDEYVELNNGKTICRGSCSIVGDRAEASYELHEAVAKAVEVEKISKKNRKKNK